MNPRKLEKEITYRREQEYGRAQETQTQETAQETARETAQTGASARSFLLQVAKFFLMKS